MKGTLLLFFVTFFIFIVSGADDSNPVISIENVEITGMGNTATANITISFLPEGLAGYNITVLLSNSSVAEIVSVEFPAWATLNLNSSLPSPSVWIKAVDLNKNVEAGATDVIVATITLKSKNEGTAHINLSITRMDNDEGYPVEVEIQNAMLVVRVNHPPSKPILSGPSSGYTGIPYVFTACATDPDGDKIRYGFDWNNDNVIDEWSKYLESGVICTVSHSWSDSGSYKIKVIAEDEYGLKSEWSDIKSIEILQPPKPNEPPIADFFYEPQHPSILDDVYFYDNSTDIDGYITKWQWNFGDGNTSNEKNPVHRYSKKGNYTVTLKIWDNAGDSSSISKQITVINIPPYPNFSISPTSPKVNQEVKFNDLSADVDGYIVNWTWDFGDGGVSYEKDPIYKFKESGKYNVTLTIRDNDGDTAKLTKQITVIKRRTPEIGVIGPILALITVILYGLKRRN